MTVLSVGCPSTDDKFGDDTDTEPLGAGNITVDPCDVDFGVMDDQKISAVSVTIENSGDGDLEITDIAVDAPFGVSATLPLVVLPGNSYQFSVRFEPSSTDFGDFAGAMTISSGDPDTPTVDCSLVAEITTDSDGDGFDTVEAGGNDCDDTDASVNPGMVEVWYDGVDQDCSGGSDFDQDADGFESKVFNDSYDPDCDPSTTVCGGDCQDVDASINPGSDDVWYDGVDQNCSGGSDFDQDGDGYRSAEYGWNDCDDQDEGVNPDSVEQFNRKDDDCNGLIDDNASTDEANIIAIGGRDDRSAGHSTALGDWDDSGAIDLAVGVHTYMKKNGGTTKGNGKGAVALFWDNGISDFDEFENDSDVYIEGDGSNDEFGYVVVNLGDFNDDGIDDLGVSAPGAAQSTPKSGTIAGFAGKVYVFSGADISTVTDTDDAILVIEGADDYHIGENLSSGVDVNGDGLGDLVSFGANKNRPDVNMAILYGGSTVTGDMEWDDFDASWWYECGDMPRYTYYKATCDGEQYSPADQGGTDTWANAASGAADFNGDGYDDIASADKFYDTETYDEVGRAWITFGKSISFNHFEATMNSTSTVVMTGTSEDHNLGSMIGAVPDVDGDGDDELLIMDPSIGDMYFFLGGNALEIGGLTAADADAIIEGVGADPSAIVNVGDWTADGRDDVGIAYGSSAVAASGGSVVILESDSWTGNHRLDSLSTGSLEGTDYNAYFGAGIAKTPGDLNGDGAMDLVVGDPGYDEDEDGAEGGVFIFYTSL
jgi:hypothetical protein